MLLFLSLRAAQQRSNLAPLRAITTRLRRFVRNDKEAAAVYRVIIAIEDSMSVQTRPMRLSVIQIQSRKAGKPAAAE